MSGVGPYTCRDRLTNVGYPTHERSDPRHPDRCVRCGDTSLTLPPSRASGTERPWHVDGVFIVNDTGRIITTMAPNDRGRADAQTIVLAVNAHDALVAALLDTANHHLDDGPCWCPVATRPMPAHAACLDARAALAKAGGKSA